MRGAFAYVNGVLLPDPDPEELAEAAGRAGSLEAFDDLLATVSVKAEAGELGGAEAEAAIRALTRSLDRLQPGPATKTRTAMEYARAGDRGRAIERGAPVRGIRIGR